MTSSAKMPPKCEFPDCKKQPTFNLEGETKARFCAEHKEPNMVNVKDKTCEFPGCKTRPNYNFEGETKAKYCSEHKEPNMVDVKHKTCEFPGCKTLPIYNFEGETKRRFCAEHRELNMVDVKHKTCEYPECKKQPTYNFEGETKAKYCAEHREPNMVNVKDRTCEFPGCKTRPNYNFEGETKAKYCSEHKEPNMVDVKHKTCEFSGCKTLPTYNLEGETKGRYCAEHREPNMVNVISKTCEFPGCKIRPTYNFEGEIKARFCAEHKEPNMVDVKNKTCEYPECKKQPTYNFPGYRQKYCSLHRTEGMILNPWKKCKNCNNQAIFINIISVDYHCEDHEAKGDLSMINPIKCDACGLEYFILTDGKCIYCNKIDAVKTERLMKQKRLKELFDMNADVLPPLITYDAILMAACNKRRPDFVFYCKDKFVVVECDEHQHADYSCEYLRMHEISQIFDMPTIFIRYNPDEYKIGRGKRQEHVPDQVRHKELIRVIKYLETHDLPYERCVSYMYYNDYSEFKITPMPSLP